MKADQQVKASWAEKLIAWPWRDVLLVGLLILIDFAIHPLTTGPDRLIHDPAVYRLANPNYLPGDWYTDMAVKSGVYLIYAKIVNAWHWLGLPEELWRHILYLTSLALLYYAIIRLARLFTKSLLVVPVIVLFHAALVAGSAQPLWLYGPFVQVDGGLAPRSIGIALSFLALFFLARERLLIASLILGLATLVHVSNSLIVFTLFLAAWVLKTIWEQKKIIRENWLKIGKNAALAVVVYLAAGGWFALFAARQSQGLPADFSTQKFIWTWIDFRAPYLNLPLVPLRSWLRLFFHILAMVFGWLWLRKKVGSRAQGPLNLLFLIGLGAFVYFFLFYLFAFVWPWLPGFQFYSLRVVYFTYFVAYLFISVLVISVLRHWLAKLFPRPSQAIKSSLVALGLLMILGLTALFGSVPGWRSMGGKWQNLQTSRQRLITDATVSRANQYPTQLPRTAIYQYLYAHPEPFLAPVGWNSTAYYLPNVASFKSFGFTPVGLSEWFTRMNDLSQGELERTYQNQATTGQFEPVTINWGKVYSSMSNEEVLSMANRYHFQLFVTYKANSYPFPLLAEDESFRLYQLPENNQ